MDRRLRFGFPSAAALRGPSSQELTHGEKLEHPVLDVAECVVILVEDARALRPGRGAPRSGSFHGSSAMFSRKVRITWDSMDSRLIRLSRPSSRSTSFRASAGSSSASSFCLSSSRSSPLVILAQLPADLLELLAEEHLPLPLAQFLLDLRLDVLLGVEHTDLALHVHQHPAQPLLDRQRLEQDLALLGSDVEVAGDQVGEPAGFVDSGQHLLDHLFRQTGLLAQLGRAGAHLRYRAHERGIFRIQRKHLLRVADDGLEITVLVGDVHARCRAARRAAGAACRPVRAAADRCGRWCRWCGARRH